jgi:hypothetical protein
MGRVRRIAAPAAAIAVCVAIASCGGSSASSSQTSSSAASSTASHSSAPTRAQFVSRGDAICRAAKGKLNAQQGVVNQAAQADRSSDTAANRQALAATLMKFAQLASPELDQFRALQPPSRDRVVISKYLAAIASQISLVQQLANAIHANDLQRVQAVSQQVSQNKATLQALAQGYGFKVCGSGR